MLSAWKPLAKVFSLNVESQVAELDHRLRALLSERRAS